jgi:hypothetical protein
MPGAAQIPKVQALIRTAAIAGLNRITDKPLSAEAENGYGILVGA